MGNILGSPCKIGTLEIKNRIVFESIGNALSELDGTVSQADIAFTPSGQKAAWPDYERGHLRGLGDGPCQPPEPVH